MTTICGDDSRSVSFDPTLLAEIGRRLRCVYDQTSEPMPDRFQMLLDRLDEHDGSSITTVETTG